MSVCEKGGGGEEGDYGQDATGSGKEVDGGDAGRDDAEVNAHTDSIYYLP